MTFELYNLVDDPMEKENLVDRHSERVAEMTKQLEAWQRSVLDSWSGKDYAK